MEIENIKEAELIEIDSSFIDSENEFSENSIQSSNNRFLEEVKNTQQISNKPLKQS